MPMRTGVARGATMSVHPPPPSLSGRPLARAVAWPPPSDRLMCLHAPCQVQRSYEFVTNLAFGVTTLHNPSLDTLSGFADAELVRSGTTRRRVLWRVRGPLTRRLALLQGKSWGPACTRRAPLCTAPMGRRDVRSTRCRTRLTGCSSVYRARVRMRRTRLTLCDHSLQAYGAWSVKSYNQPCRYGAHACVSLVCASTTVDWGGGWRRGI
jgi:hypothetical protein